MFKENTILAHEILCKTWQREDPLLGRSSAFWQIQGRGKTQDTTQISHQNWLRECSNLRLGL